MDNYELIESFKEKLNNAKTGDDIREVIFTAVSYNLNSEEIEKILSVHFSDEKWEEIIMSDKGVSK